MNSLSTVDPTFRAPAILRDVNFRWGGLSLWIRDAGHSRRSCCLAALTSFENFDVPHNVLTSSERPDDDLAQSRDGWVHPVLITAEELLKECSVRRQKRSGPGGQHRNKVETGVFLKHEPTGIEAHATERRSQLENQSKAVKRLRVQLALEIRSEQRALAAPSALWKSRLQEGKIVVSEEHFDFATLLSEALDVLNDTAWEPGRAAERLGCTVSQLVKLLKKELQAFALLNRHREQRGVERWR
ncbi:MAG: peptide chain release factor-like protein [Planctomyces sp.]|nr:peptide chain release factor-like protein [Planctomyces sp.]